MLGRTFSRKRVMGSAAFNRKGVVKVVSTDTATMMGYRKAPVTFRDWPRPAMMKENSPTWVWEAAE